MKILRAFLLIMFILSGVVIRYGFAEEGAPLTSLKCNIFTFDASGSYDPDNEKITYLWDFGDGKTSDELIVIHTYEKSGDYQVKLSLTDNSGMKCSTATTVQAVRVNIPPRVDFTLKETACVNEPVLLNVSKKYNNGKKALNYAWNFGDGTIERNKKQVTKVYTKGGAYTVALKADDSSHSACSTRVVEKTIQINEPPVAEAGDNVIFKCAVDGAQTLVTFDASGSSDSNNDVLTYRWDFGDGQMGMGIKVSHQYDEVGNYDVKLIVTDGSKLGCGTGVDFVSVKLNQAPRAVAGEGVTTCVDEDVIFDGSGSFIHKKGTSEARWFFGDGEAAEGIKATHRYNKPGKYQASLLVKNKLNSICPPSRDMKMVMVNSVPTVEIKPISPVCLGTELEFDASSAMDPDGDTLEYYWSFGDGTILRTGAKTMHKYQQGGDYRVTVIVDDGNSTSCSTATANIDVKINSAPVADAGSNLTCCTNKSAEFNATASTDSDGDRLIYAWDFGDGTNASGAVVEHIYAKSGSYKVTLTVDDNSATACSHSSASFTAVVNSTPVPVIRVR